jgi:hypothetical protein
MMRILFAIPLLLLLGGCQVSKDNNGMSVTYNSDVAENALSDVGNTAENIGADIGNDVSRTADKVQNKVGNTDVDVNADVHTNSADQNHQ